MEQEIQQLRDEVTQMRQFIESLNAAGKFPKTTEDAIRERLQIENISAFTTSSKSNVSESQSVDEAGVASYNVFKNPDIFLKVTINGTIYYVPAFTS